MPMLLYGLDACPDNVADNVWPRSVATIGRHILSVIFLSFVLKLFLI